MDAERRLIEAAQRDPGRFADLYEQNFERVYAYVVRRVRDRHDAQDITGEVFQQALANIARFQWRGVPFAAWLYRIAANAIADHMRKSSREVDIEPDAMATSDLHRIEERAAVFRSVSRLPVEQRRVIVMRFVEGKSIREIAQEIGKSEGAVKQLQWRGLQTLRAQMSQSHV
ncbi:MAG TPA: RNA polymerase sigma factor [Thermoanaerobaculia bacterium]|nr:RNA polymerase sigma factor [Thermoanaerobaculia bacterium]